MEKRLLLPIYGEVARRAGGDEGEAGPDAPIEGRGPSPPHSWGGGPVGRRGRGIYQSSEPLLELPQSDVLDLQRQLEVLRDALRLLGEARVGHLAKIEDRLVVGEEN